MGHAAFRAALWITRPDRSQKQSDDRVNAMLTAFWKIGRQFSAAGAARKWPCDLLRGAAETTIALALLGVSAALGQAALKPVNETSSAKPALAMPSYKTNVPLPRPRPADAQGDPEQARTGEGTGVAKPGDERQGPSAPSACRLALTDAIAVAPSVPDITGPQGCDGKDLVRLEAIILPDGRRVAVTPAAILRCPMASEVVDWIRSDMPGLTASLGAPLSVLDNFDSFECRGRNRVAGAKLSEHGLANALDVRALRLANGQSLSLTDRNVLHEWRENVMHSVCARFSTVLGPGSDWYHEDHVHLDLAARRNGYRICQWDVWDPLPAIAPMLPSPRPEEAPPRDSAEPTADKEVAAPAEEPPHASAKPDPGKANPPSATKKRRKNRRF